MTNRDKARQLRQRAAICRQAAGHRTTGGHIDDLLLRALADSLDRRAEALEKAAVEQRTAAN